jgi:putative restriction endonuclease
MILVRVEGSSVADAAVTAELGRRRALWQQVQELRQRGSLTSQALDTLGISRGQQGIFRDISRTAAVSGDSYGVTVSVRHTGRIYADDLSDDSLLYHYPVTGRGDRDRNEIEATKNARRLALPIFVNIGAGRDVRAGWVEDWDDDAQVFLMGFNDALAPVPTPSTVEEPMELIVTRERKYGLASRRSNAPRFRFTVMKRYGAVCAVCDVRIPELLEAAHLVPWERGGTDDPRNGLVLCALHHRAFDARMFAMEPDTQAVRTAEPYSQYDLKITRGDLSQRERVPHWEALKYVWQEFTRG